MAIYGELAFDLGEDWIFNHYAFEADGVTPLDTTGATVEFQASSGPGSPVFVPAQASVTPINALVGQNQIRVTPAQQTASGVVAGQYGFTVRIILASGIVTDQTYGALTVRGTAFS